MVMIESVVVISVIVGLAFVAVYRPWELSWGATREELARSMRGDEVVSRPTFDATRAVTVGRPPEDVWPWIVQIGYGRGGWYSYDLLDNLGRHSTERILPELQHISVGDLIPMGPGDGTGMWVKEFVPDRSTLWWDRKNQLTTWAWALDPMPDGKTRLVTRVRSTATWRHPMTMFWLLMVEVADFPMMRKCLLGIKRRAEALEPAETSSPSRHGLPWTVGMAAVVFSVLYFVSDLIELAQGGFSLPRLALTGTAEAAVPFFVIGLYVAQRPRIGRLGLIGAIGYAYSFVFFTGTVVFAMVKGTDDWSALSDRLGAWVVIHGVVMVIAGSAFGLAVIRAGVLPRWTGVALIAGVVLVGASSGLPEIAQTVAAGVRDLAWAGMGASSLVAGRAAPPPAQMWRSEVMSEC
jgi:hypothetical protein